MNIKKLFNLSLVLILGFILSGCANSQFAKKYNKPFKHNTPLIKKDMRSIGKAEIAKTLEMGPKPVEGDKVIERKRKKITSETTRNYLLIPNSSELLLFFQNLVLCDPHFRIYYVSLGRRELSHKLSV